MPNDVHLFRVPIGCGMHAIGRNCEVGCTDRKDDIRIGTGSEEDNSTCGLSVEVAGMLLN